MVRKLLDFEVNVTFFGAMGFFVGGEKLDQSFMVLFGVFVSTGRST